ncbi:hypothetical protein BGZ50_002367 [Haplosporangium sp. Z 11]|nr:hypothetical protein BGZ50_002367 [Haplosporangium sp. Z 11]
MGNQGEVCSRGHLLPTFGPLYHSSRFIHGRPRILMKKHAGGNAVVGSSALLQITYSHTNATFARNSAMISCVDTIAQNMRTGTLQKKLLSDSTYTNAAFAGNPAMTSCVDTIAQSLRTGTLQKKLLSDSTHINAAFAGNPAMTSCVDTIA